MRHLAGIINENSFKDAWKWKLLFILNLFVASQLYGQIEEIPYGVGQWEAATLGNHRAIIHVAKFHDAVAVQILWRRRDLQPEKKNVIVIDAQTGQRIANVYRVYINREFGNLIFQPQTAPGDYYVYFMPFLQDGRSNYPTVTYSLPEHTAAESWLKKNNLTSLALAAKKWVDLPRASCKEIQSIDTFNSFYPMEVIAPAAGLKEFIAANPNKKYYLFPENRKYPIRMTDDLPLKWIKTGLESCLEANAARGEYYAFQIGVYALQESINDLHIDFSDLKKDDGKDIIPASKLNCFNVGGYNWNGLPFKKSCPIEKGKVQALWCGIHVPINAGPGRYIGNITVTPLNMEPQNIELHLTVNENVLADAGVNEPEKMARLHWLDPRIAFDYDVVLPFIPLRMGKSKTGILISCLGRDITLDSSGLPASIVSYFSPEVTEIHLNNPKEILTAPFQLIVETLSGEIVAWKSQGITITDRYPGLIAWKSQNIAADGSLTMDCSAAMECDGFIESKISLKTTRELSVKDIRLEIPIKKSIAKYMMGLGERGGYRPQSIKWKWSVTKNQDSAWLGDANAGIHFNLRDANYSRPLNTNFYHSKPLIMPLSWDNGGKGGIDIIEQNTKNEYVLIKCYGGDRLIKPGTPLHYDFNLLLTPFKTIDTGKQWSTRFFHQFKPLDQIKTMGANTINVHHATEINPFINYPFLRPTEMKAYIDEAHQKGLKVKIYNTIRELSNRAPEIFALQSLGDEVISKGPGGEFSWLQEHLNGNYIAGWFVPEYKDAAIINSGMSRWHNYYLEGINWLVNHVGIDGLYIDDLAFDRTTMKRLRKILDRGRKGALIDLHPANQYNPRDGFTNSANLYLEHFPYIDRLWFGEYFDYNSSPDFWLVEVSGIPFGLMGEMLQDSGNPRRGMLYGMTSRLPWAGNPGPIWKAWDDFAIKDSNMMGYWSSNCPVKTNSNEILATAYVVKGKRALIAIASWAKESTFCRLSLDWKTLGLHSHKAFFDAPEIKDFQPARHFKLTDDIPVEPAKGWLLIVK